VSIDTLSSRMDTHTPKDALTLRQAIAFILAIAATWLAASPALAELRTAHYTSPPGSSQGSASNPQIKSVVLRYDSAAGSLSAQVQFFSALADPQQTSALHNATVDIGLGDAFGGDGEPDCERSKAGIYVVAGLGDDAAPSVAYSEFSVFLSRVSASKSFTPDRTEIDLTVQSPRFVNLNLICWYADSARSSGNGSLTGYRLLDGFTPRDGDTNYVAREDLELEAGYVNNNLGHPRNPIPFGNGPGFNCRNDSLGGSFCRVRQRLPSIVGKPLLTIVGSQYFTVRTVPDSFGQQDLVWHYDERAALIWPRCPSRINPAKKLIGRPCSIKTDWTGTRPLYQLL
jgi:hypothetical protein